MSLVGMLYNAQLMRYGGQNGIAAYGVLMYVSMIFHACFIGYAVGVSPVVSFHFGAQYLAGAAQRAAQEPAAHRRQLDCDAGGGRGAGAAARADLRRL